MYTLLSSLHPPFNIWESWPFTSWNTLFSLLSLHYYFIVFRTHWLLHSISFPIWLLSFPRCWHSSGLSSWSPSLLLLLFLPGWFHSFQAFRESLGLKTPKFIPPTQKIFLNTISNSSYLIAQPGCFADIFKYTFWSILDKTSHFLSTNESFLHLSYPSKWLHSSPFAQSRN